ncbi:hypothetical protein CICLE_v10033552mg [Citrus x clementina]|uniref:Uncharacterized protein n=1 Tax=Citrus clementina TaxID=85681 RepID=V4SVM6_CITCL|nr:hypothetical protein CICLE_v10033552mg [Citrus x clementina]
MESNEDIGIKIYTANPQNDPTPNPSSPSRLEPRRKRRAVAKGMQETFSKTSMLVNFLPTGTLLTFEMLLPSVSNNGYFSPVSTQIIHSLLGLCSLSCFFFHFTDSFKVHGSSDGEFSSHGRHKLQRPFLVFPNTRYGIGRTAT